MVIIYTPTTKVLYSSNILSLIAILPGNCAAILSLYLPVAISGYAVFGFGVDSNILFQTTQGAAVKAAMTLQVINLLGSYVIGFNTVSQAVEDILKIPIGK